jgi:hypothetical protein
VDVLLCAVIPCADMGCAVPSCGVLCCAVLCYLQGMSDLASPLLVVNEGDEVRARHTDTFVNV